MTRDSPIIVVALSLIPCAPALAQEAGPAAPRYAVEASVEIPNPYSAYAFLIGDWDTKPSGGPDIAIHQQFRWGPKRSYITYTTLIREGGKPEAIHFEGILVWNAASKALDYVIAAEPGSGAQEKGIMRVEPDGALVREVTMTRADGGVAHFRQTFRQIGANTATTSLMRQTAKGWEPNFPGSENLVMIRRAS